MVFGQAEKIIGLLPIKIHTMIINRKGAGACVIIAHHKFTFIGIKAFLQYMHDLTRSVFHMLMPGHMKGHYGSFSGYTLNWNKYDIHLYGIILLRQDFNCKYLYSYSYTFPSNFIQLF